VCSHGLQNSLHDSTYNPGGNSRDATMISLTDNHGQALVETSLALWLLILTFFMVGVTFMMAIDKIHALDEAFHVARAYQVQTRLSSFKKQAIQFLCFAKSSDIQYQIESRQGPGIHKVTVKYSPPKFLI